MRDKIIVAFLAHYLEQTDVAGQILIEDRDTDFYYCWSVQDDNKRQIAGKCLPVSKRIIPPDSDEIQFIIDHAVVSINNFQIDRRKAFTVKLWMVS